MCCCFEKKTIQRIGWIITLGFLIGAVVCIILAGVNFNATFTDFREDGWQSLAAVELASIIYVLVLGVLGFLTFCCDWTILTIIFAILVLISTVFTGAIAILALVGGSVGKLESYVGCNTKYTGVLDAWNNIDTYLIQTDTYLCSDECPCSITNTTAFTTNSNAVGYYNQWVKTGQAIAFQNCTSTVTDKAYNSFIAASPVDTKFNATLFADYMQFIETSFDCSGWCQTKYTSAKTKTLMEMYKYQFSDVNRGIPENIGCLKSIIDWLPPLLNGFGAIAICVTALEAFVFALAISLCCSKNKKNTTADKPNA